jgi:MoxR-like ATPase
MPKPSLLRELGIVGYDVLESVIVAGLATEFPMLLIGPHGTAKSLLLNWLALTLGLQHRHYNAAMINFDDLVGFPFPNDARTSLDYIPTRGSIWGAQSVFIDEISRTRVDMQNRLFPIIHEKVIQGIPLTDLRYRWAAMNPPPPADKKQTLEWSYEGSEALDVALADRFPLVVCLPSFSDFSETDKLAVISGKPEQEAPTAKIRLEKTIVDAKSAWGTVKKSLSDNIAAYVLALQPMLTKMRRPISPRRARMIHDVVAAVVAAEGIAGRRDPKPAAFLALSHALPHPAYGQNIDQAELLAAHQQAWKLAEIPPTDPKRLVFAESDPVKRVSLGLEVGLEDLDLSVLVQDAYASLDERERLCFAVALWPVVSTTRNLSAIAYETLAKDWMEVENQSSRRHSLASGSRRHRQWQILANWISEQPDKNRDDKVLVNIALVLFEREVDFEPSLVKRSWQRFITLFPWD